VAVAALRHRAGHEVDAELARKVPRPRDRTALERLGIGAVVGGRSADVEALGEHDQLGAVGCGGAHVALGRREILLHVGARLQLDGGGPQLRHPLPAID
jgi:hypothetical protein